MGICNQSSRYRNQVDVLEFVAKLKASQHGWRITVDRLMCDGVLEFVGLSRKGLWRNILDLWKWPIDVSI